MFVIRFLTIFRQILKVEEFLKFLEARIDLKITVVSYGKHWGNLK